MKKWTAGLLVLAAIAFVGFTGCDTLFGKEEEDPNGTLVFQNNIGGKVYCVYIASYDGVLPTQDTRGENKLAAGEVIENGAKKSFSLAPGSYEVVYTYYNTTTAVYNWTPLVLNASTIYKFNVTKGQTIGANVTATSWSDYTGSARGAISSQYPLGDAIKE